MSDARLRTRLEQIGSELDLTTHAWTARRRRRRRTALAAASAFVVVVVVSLAASGIATNDAGQAVAGVLRKAAEAVNSKPLAPGEYYYEKTRTSSRVEVPVGTRQLDSPPEPGAATYAVVVTTTTESWNRPGEPGRQQSTPATLTFPSSYDREQWDAAAPPAPSGTAPSSGVPHLAEQAPGDLRFRRDLLGAYGLTARQLERAAADQAKFDHLVESRVARALPREQDQPQGANDADLSVFRFTGEALGGWGEPMPPQLRIAFYQLASRLHGISAKLEPGSNGKRVTISGGGTALQFSTRDYRLLGTRFDPDGTGRTDVTRVDQGVVGSDSARP